MVPSSSSSCHSRPATSSGCCQSGGLLDNSLHLSVRLVRFSSLWTEFLINCAVAWGFIPNFSCDPTLLGCDVGPEPCCHKTDNWGWRYLVLTLGALTFMMFVARFFFFHLFESPKFLLSRGRQPEAVAVVHGIAFKNNKKTWLTEEILSEIGGYPGVAGDRQLSNKDIVKRQFEKFSTERIKPLFANRKLGINTALLWFCEYSTST